MTDADILAVEWYEQLDEDQRLIYREEFDTALYDAPLEVLNEMDRIDAGKRAFCLG